MRRKIASLSSNIFVVNGQIIITLDPIELKFMKPSPKEMFQTPGLWCRDVSSFEGLWSDFGTYMRYQMKSTWCRECV